MTRCRVLALSALLSAVVLAACGGDDASDDACATSAGTPARRGSIAVGDGELSGVAASHRLPGVLWTHADSGNDALVYAVNAGDATSSGALALTGVANVDWEDIATAPCGAGLGERCLYVADTGDNDGERAAVALLEVVEPSAPPVGEVQTSSRTFAIAYPDGPHDLEALFVDPRDGKSYGIAKQDAPAAPVFELPRVDAGTATAVPIGSFTVPRGDDQITAADLLVTDCGLRLLVRSRERLFELVAAPGADIATLVAATPTEVPVADEEQGEGVAWSATGDAYFTVSEGDDPPLWRVDVAP